jgi:predicted alpha/beta hydrolase family esterase
MNKRSTIRHANWRGRRANNWIASLGDQVKQMDTTTLYFHSGGFVGIAIKRK